MLKSRPLGLGNFDAMDSKLSERDSRCVWHPYTQAKLSRFNIPIVSGDGALLFDNEGKSYIDAISSWWVNLHGHGHQYIAKKLAEQFSKLDHVIFAGFTHEPAVTLAERLLKHLPEEHSRIFFSDNGSTAVEVGVKMAIQYWINIGKPRKRVLAFKGGYHGDTFGSMSVSGRGAFTKPFEDLLFDVQHIDLPFSSDIDVSRLEEFFTEQVAAFIFEPLILGAGGMIMYPAAALDKIIETCKVKGILTIADEVMTGFNRTGKMFASDYLTNKPDIICLSKGLTGGIMPMGVTTSTEKVYEAFLSDDRTKTFFHGHSYTGNPIGCAAALASLDLLEQESCQDRIKNIDSSHLRFAEKLKEMRNIQNIRCLGTILAFDFVSDLPTEYFNVLRDNLYKSFIESGVLLRPLGNVVYVMPPYCISADQLEKIYKVIESAAIL